VAAEGYQEVLMLSRIYLGMADMFGAKTPALVLPTLGKLLPHVTPAASVAWVDQTGWHMKQITPFPGSEILSSGGLGSIMAAQQALFVAISTPSLARSRVVANRVKDASNLRQIGLAMQLYANENKGKYPKSMGELFLTQDITIDAFVNPEMMTRAPTDKNREEQALWVSKNSDYEYLGAGKDVRTKADIVVAHGKIKPGAQGVNVLYADGHVEFMDTFAVQQSLAKQKEAEMKKGGQ
jgi:prepilin-type processing-associated H-X9-DG protein